MARSGHNFVVNNVMSWLDKNDGEGILHHNLENIEPHRIVPNHLKWGGPKMLIWRDFDNWLASIIMKSYKMRPTRSWEDIPVYIDKVCKIYWAQQGEKRSPQHFVPHVPIHYEEFVKSQRYRKAVCAAVGGEYNEKMLNHVATQANGSSFDGITLQGRGSEMDVLNRSKAILKTEHKEFYLKILEEYGRGF